MNDFKIATKIKELIYYYEKYISVLIPKSLIVIKFKLEDNLYTLIDNTVRANVNKGNVRKKYQNEILYNIGMADFYTGILMDKKIIKKRKFNSLINMYNVIRLMTYGWINSDEKESLSEKNR